MTYNSHIEIPPDLKLDESALNEAIRNVDDVFVHVMRVAEQAARRKIFTLLGYWPTNAEIREHGQRAYFQANGAIEYRWDDTLLVRIEPPDFGGENPRFKVFV